MTRTRIIASVVAALLLSGVVAGFAVAWRPAISAIEPPAPRSFDPALVKRGRDLAALGNCNDCHTVRGGKAFAGGLPVPTPFGTIYSSNITPDAETGIGHWSEAAFRRAMRSGVNRDGQHLYPTFPYDHFTNVTDEDDQALYAYLMTRPAVHATAPANRLSFPFDQRFVVAGWKLLFLRRGTYQPDSTQSAEWNRGAYLVEGLAHCGACHTPRNALGAERTGASFAGGDVDNWNAYAINARSPSPVPWDAAALFAYLRQGWHPDHGVARGPMAEVVSNLSSVDESDVHAIADLYDQRVRSPRHKTTSAGAMKRSRKPNRRPVPSSQTEATGAAIYAAACATCHETGRPLPYGGVNLGPQHRHQRPRSAQCGQYRSLGHPARGGRTQPDHAGLRQQHDRRSGFSGVELSAQSSFSNQPAWTGVEKTVEDARRTQTVFLQTSAGPQNAPADPTQRDKP